MYELKNQKTEMKLKEKQGLFQLFKTNVLERKEENFRQSTKEKRLGKTMVEKQS